jgi:hypothetical protein
MIDDGVYKLVSLCLQLLVLPAGALLWFLLREVQSLRVTLYREFVTKEELATTKGEMRDTMQIAVSAFKNGAEHHRSEDWRT